MDEPASGRAAVRATALTRGPRDPRGDSFTLAGEQLAFLGEPHDVHVASILPGQVRGEHYHAERRELIVVIHEDDFSLHWDEGPGTEAHCRTFTGAGAVAITIEPLAAHALRNDGALTLWLLAASDRSYDQTRPDTHPRPVVQRLSKPLIDDRYQSITMWYWTC